MRQSDELKKLDKQDFRVNINAKQKYSQEETETQNTTKPCVVLGCGNKKVTNSVYIRKCNQLNGIGQRETFTLKLNIEGLVVKLIVCTFIVNALYTRR